MASSMKSQRRCKRVEALLKKAGASASETPTNILFVSNSSVLCGVPLEKLEEIFHQFDSHCSFIVYPTKRSYSFVIFSDVSRAIEAFNSLDGTKPFKADKTTGISLVFISQLPEEESMPIDTSTKALDGLTLLFEFISRDEETALINSIETTKFNISSMKNRDVFHFGHEFNYADNSAFVRTHPIPEFFTHFIDRIMHAAYLPELLRPDQITVNVYDAGQGIPPHVDTHSAFEEPIISLSLLSDVVMEFRDCANSADLVSVLLPQRSLMVMRSKARYRYRHGIMSRKYDVNPLNDRLMARRKRISITFRKIRTQPCSCPFVEFCDWDRGKMAIPETNSDGQQLEREYVSNVYEQIAEHFDETRRSHWGLVNRFLDGLSTHSIVIDAGCGNGKYLIRRDSLCKIGCDVCANLVAIAYKKSCSVLCADALHLPIRSCSVDAVLSIAVIHHFSTKERRQQALKEALRVLKPGGLACVTVWSMEQKDVEKHESAYAKMRSHKIDTVEDEITKKKTPTRLKVHDGKTFKQQDMLVPWNDVNSGKQFFRYYHLFAEDELPQLLAELPNCKLISSEYEEGNWAVIFERK